MLKTSDIQSAVPARDAARFSERLCVRLCARLCALSALALLAGCTTYVTVVSDPEGAAITDPTGAVAYGEAPVEIAYDRSELERAGGVVPGYKATWPSGAAASTVSPLTVTDLRYGMTVTLKRPADAPGVEKDLEHALKNAQQRAKNAEAERDRLQLYLDSGWGPGWGPGWGWGWGWRP